MSLTQLSSTRSLKKDKLVSLRKNIIRDKELIIIVLPVVIHYLIFSYFTMYGNIIAFKDYSPVEGIFGSQWIGLKYFQQFFDSIFLVRLIKNTVLISVFSILWGFPIPIIFALMINELRDGPFKRVVQTVSYFPNFISVVVIVGIVMNFLSPSTGIINVLLQNMGIEPIHFMMEPGWFRTVYIGSGIWQSFGWTSIIYLAALSGIDQEMYQAAKVDGASRFKQVIYISIPSILPTIVILLILQIGNIMSVGFEKIILMYNPATLDVADVISTYTYRRGIVEGDYSFGTAVGLFNSLINFILIVAANKISKKLSDISLW